MPGPWGRIGGGRLDGDAADFLFSTLMGDSAFLSPRMGLTVWGISDFLAYVNLITYNVGVFHDIPS